jgi:5-methylcytosine-specific restriction endonuclease McrA
MDRNSLKNLEKGKQFRFKKGRISDRRGKTNEQIYGKEKSKEIQTNASKSRKGVKTNRITYRGGWHGKHSEKTKEMLRKRSKEQFKNGMSQKTREKIRDTMKKKRIMVGEGHWNWQGGKSKIRDRLKHTLQYSKWRLAIYVRDGFKCQNCGQVGYKLHAHHIKPLSKILKEENIKTVEEAMKCQEIWNIGNGITLCEECHKETESYLNNKVT